VELILTSAQAVTDFPCGAFALELVEAYPEAKVILTTRDPATWYKSIMSTIAKAFKTPVMKAVPYIDPRGLGRWTTMCATLWIHYFKTFDATEEQMTTKFHEHYESLRKAVPKDRILEFRAADGWEPLCKFLGKDIPAQPYPRVNESAGFEKSLFGVVGARFKVLLKEVAKIVIPLSIVGAAIYYVRR
jgi:hypothetical protein